MALRVKIIVKIPKAIMDISAVRQNITDTLQHKTAMDLKTEFRKTIFGWANKPSFRQKYTERSAYISEQVYADGPNADQYSLVNFGAKEHPIEAVNYPLLRFRRGYRASTRPHFIGSRRNYRSGPYEFRKRVWHHGFTAREFDITIADDYMNTFAHDIQNAIIQGIVNP